MRIDECPIKAAIDVIGGKWKPLILFELKSGSRRFGELRRAVSGARHKVLIEQLRQLERDGIISRTVHPGKVVHTEYQLSGHGESLRPVLASLANWGTAYREQKLEPGRLGEPVIEAEGEILSAAGR